MTDDCYQQIKRAMLGDQFRLRQQWQKMEKLATQGKPVDQMRAAWTTRIEQSIALRDLRETQQPTPTFSDALPINAKRDEIAAIIRDHQVTVVCGETGSGKSTQIPKLCLSLGRGLSGYIGTLNHVALLPVLSPRGSPRNWGHRWARPSGSKFDLTIK